MLLLFKKYKRHVKKVQFPCFIVQENICTLFEKKSILSLIVLFEKNMELDVKKHYPKDWVVLQNQ